MRLESNSLSPLSGSIEGILTTLFYQTFSYVDLSAPTAYSHWQHLNQFDDSEKF